MTIPRDTPAAPTLADNPSTYLRLNLIPIFFLLLGVGSALWMFTFNVFLTRSKVVAFLRTLSVSGPRARKAFTELKRKSFHLMGLLIPSIWYLGLHYSDGLITRPFGIGLLGAVTAFIWVVELLRWISPAFRAHYNRLFSSIMRKHELVADAAAGLVKPEEGSLAHTVDELVKTITTPLLGELPESPSERQGADSSTPYLRSAAAAAGASSSTSQTASQFSTPADYHKYDKPGVSPRTAAAGAPPKIESEKIFTGMPFFLSGMWLSMVFFTPTIATCAMLFLILGDMSAAICGISWGTIKIGRKSLEGTVAMFIVCYVIGSIFFFNQSGSTSVVFLAALSATLVELLGPADKWYGDDNLTIPCLLSSTPVALYAGGSVPASSLAPGTRLIGQYGEAATILSVRHGSSSTMYKIVYTSGAHTVTPHHLVTLQWHLNPSFDGTETAVREGHKYAALQISWYDRYSLEKMTKRWRYTPSGYTAPAADKVMHADVEEAIEAAMAFGDKMIFENRHESGWTTGHVTTDEKSAAAYITLHVSGPQDRYHFKVPNSAESDVPTRVYAPILPVEMAPFVREFAREWLRLAELRGEVSPLRRFDLFDVRADVLARLQTDAEWLRRVSVPVMRMTQSSAGAMSIGSLSSLPSASSTATEVDSEMPVLVHPTADDSPPLSEAEELPHEEQVRLFMAERVPSSSSAPSPVTVVYSRVVERRTPVAERTAEDEDAPVVELPDPAKKFILDRYAEGVNGKKIHAELASMPHLTNGVRLTFALVYGVIHAAGALRPGCGAAASLSVASAAKAASSSQGVDQPAGVLVAQHLAGFDAAVKAARDLKTGRDVCEPFSQMVIGGSDGEKYDYRPVQESDDIDVVYMLHDPLVPDSMMDAQGPRAFTIRQLERAWKTWGLDAAKLKIMVTEVHPLTGLTGLLDSREPRFDGVPGAAMSAALARSPRVIIAFGAYTRARWLRDTRNLPGVTSAVLVAPSLETEVQEESAMIVTMTDQSQVKVFFAPHPSAFFLFDGVLAAVADAHGVEYDRATLAATARSRSHLLSVEKVAGGQFVAVEVDTPDSRFLLSDGALTHNCATGIAFTAAFKVFTGSIPE